MANYTKTTNFAAKDSLPSGSAGKIIKGTEHDTEYNNIATAIGTKLDAASGTATNLGVVGFTFSSGTISNLTTDLAVADGGTGASTVGAARANLLPSYSGNASKVLSVNSGSTDIEWATPSGIFSTYVILTSGTSWTAPAGITKIKVICIGGGGAGRWNASNQYFGGGGGTAIKYFTVTPGTSYTYAIGAGAVANVSGSGGSSTFTVGAVTITGGGGGSPFQSGYPGAGGTATNGDINIQGQPGAFFAGTAGDSGLGGGTFLAPYTSANAGVVRNNPVYGAGSSVNGNGADGVIVIEY